MHRVHMQNETEHTLRLKLYQGFVLYFVDASNRGVETKEIRLEAIETTREGEGGWMVDGMGPGVRVGLREGEGWYMR